MKASEAFNYLCILTYDKYKNDNSNFIKFYTIF